MRKCKSLIGEVRKSPQKVEVTMWAGGRISEWQKRKKVWLVWNGLKVAEKIICFDCEAVWKSQLANKVIMFVCRATWRSQKRIIMLHNRLFAGKFEIHRKKGTVYICEAGLMSHLEQKVTVLACEEIWMSQLEEEVRKFSLMKSEFHVLKGSNCMFFGEILNTHLKDMFTKFVLKTIRKPLLEIFLCLFAGNSKLLPPPRPLPSCCFKT